MKTTRIYDKNNQSSQLHETFRGNAKKVERAEREKDERKKQRKQKERKSRKIQRNCVYNAFKKII